MTDYPPAPVRPPFSKLIIAGFVISCVSLVIFGFIGVVGVVLSARGYRAARRGLVSGRWLAVAGIVIGILGFGGYVILLVTSTR